MKWRLIFMVFLLFFIFSDIKIAFADSTSGYAWSENSGWIDFSQVTVSNGTLSGYAHSSNIGFISLNCDNTDSCDTVDYKVINSSGTLSGYAWSENSGWIDFSQATISTSSGIFSGYAYSPNIGFISFNCSNTSSCETVDYKVMTDWRAPVARRSGSYIKAIPIITPPSTTITTTCLSNITRTLKMTTPRMKGDDVKDLQKCLNNKAPSLSFNLLLDGVFGSKTKQAVTLFQQYNSLKIDGIVGPLTRNKLK